MKKIVMFVAISLWAQTCTADVMRVAVTTSFENSGLSDVLLPAIKEDIDLDVQLLVVGTGQALRLGEAPAGESRCDSDNSELMPFLQSTAL
jgi:tungstate transport system substrate-binding protein